MKVQDIIKLIEKDGWYRVVTEGSHRQYKHPEKWGRVTIALKFQIDSSDSQVPFYEEVSDSDFGVSLNHLSYLPPYIYCN